MEIKRRLTAVAKRFGTEIEHLNIKHEILRICKRLEELADYADEKVERMKAAEKHGRKFQKQDDAVQAEKDRIAAIHAAEAEEALADQQQAKAELSPREVDNFDAYAENEDGEVMFDPDAPVDDETAEATAKA